MTSTTNIVSPQVFVCDLRHYLDLPMDVPSPVRRMAEHLTLIVTGEPIDPDPDEDAAANGSLMRLAPVSIRWHADPGEAAAVAAESGEASLFTPERGPVLKRPALDAI